MKKQKFEGYTEKGMDQGWQYSIPNPMHKTAFEQSLCEREVREREEATLRYVKGIQGTDGGKFPSQEYSAQVPLNPSNNPLERKNFPE